MDEGWDCTRSESSGSCNRCLVMFENGHGSFGDLRGIWKAYFFVPEASEKQDFGGGNIDAGFVQHSAE